MDKEKQKLGGGGEILEKEASQGFQETPIFHTQFLLASTLPALPSYIPRS